MKYQAIFFDVDGVLVDSETVFNVSWRKAAEQEGYQMTFDQALELRSLDSSLAKELFLSWFGNENAYPVIRATRKKIMTEIIKQKSLKAKTGVKEFLSRIKELPIKTVIVTSSPVSRIISYLASVGIDIKEFDAVITTENVQRGKPFPDVYLYACDVIKFQPWECIAVEDSPNGVKSAHTAGCYTVMVPDLSPYTDSLTPYVDMNCDTLYDLYKKLF